MKLLPGLVVLCVWSYVCEAQLTNQELTDAIKQLREDRKNDKKEMRAEIIAAKDVMKEYRNELNAKLDDLKTNVNNGRNRTNNLIKSVQNGVQNERNNTKLRIQNIGNNLNDFRADVRALMAEMRETMDEAKRSMDSQIGEIEEQNEVYRDTIKYLSRQTMLLQFGMEERVRSDGDSGIKVTRGMSKGPDNYYETGLFGPNFNMIHDHSNYERTVGMGEVISVLNGVEFRTRHNDYKLKMPSTTSTDFHATEDIPFPGVPPSVTGTVDEQITEMREWFKAFATQNKTHRNYPDYFKPVLCYLEGAWTLDTKKLDEPFESDRHQIDASSWFDLQERLRFASYTGTKSRLENFANLPTTIMSVNDTTGLPQYAQWNYRILCHPLKEDIPIKELRQVDDLAYRVPRDISQADANKGRGARYRLYEEEEDKFTQYSKLDRLFYSIPGKDNIPGELRQESFGDKMIDLGTDNGTLLNTGYYHRFFKFDKSGAMGLQAVARGFNDANMWVAQTTQERIAPIQLKTCPTKRTCRTLETRFSYAIPLEIIYMTPLLSWNPFDLETGKTGKDIRAGGRNGRHETALAYNGTGPTGSFYMTPSKFFQGRVDQSDPADTVRNAVGVLDKQGVMKKVTPSGTKIFLQNIQGIDNKIRLRYPISPIHGEGSPVWKELNALKKLVKDQGLSEGVDTNINVLFTMSPTTQEPPGEHTHEFTIDLETFLRMYQDGEVIIVETTMSHNHKHKLKVRYLADGNIFEYTRCDKMKVCWDGHARKVELITDVTSAIDSMVNPQSRR